MQNVIFIFRILFFFAFAFYVSHLFAQTSAPPGIFQNEVYSHVKIDSNILYGGNFNHLKNQYDSLHLDIYHPDSVVDYRRPLLIYCHGGGFVNGNKKTDKAKDFGNTYAKHGYVVASIDYRLGISSPDTVIKYRAVYQAAQDGMAAVRYFHKHAEDYCLDTSSFFIIGTSAGGTIAVLVPYLQTEEFTEWVDTAEYGNLETSSGNAGYSSAVTAAIDCWGGITDTTWLIDETEPILDFHGTDDPIVPYSSGISYDGVFLYGGEVIYAAAQDYGIESYLHPFVGVGHGVQTSAPQFDTLLEMTTSFMFEHLTPGLGDILCPDIANNTIPKTSNDVIKVQSDFDGKVTITSNYNVNDLNVSVFNLSGQIVKSITVSLCEQCSFVLDCSDVIAGNYFLKSSEKQLSIVHKLIIVH